MPPPYVDRGHRPQRALYDRASVRTRARPDPAPTDGGPMSNRVYRVTEIVGTSPEGIDQAIRNGIERAS